MGVGVDKELFSDRFKIERKLFSFELRENQKGRFLRITEDVAGRRDTIIMPATGLDRVRDVLDRAIRVCDDAGPSESANAG